jgi:hypothetical protein
MSAHQSSLRPRRWVGATLTLLFPAFFGGCVAFNIPSVRFDDPRDRGGILGPHRQTDPEELEMMREMAASESCGPGGIGGGICASQFDEEDIDGGEKPETPPEVPWPRFHPLPTRPVFSSPTF